MKSKPQGKLEGTIVGNILKTRVAVIAANWVFQGMRYMNLYEIGLKMLLNVVIASLFIFLMLERTSAFSVIIISIVISHTINWIINGHFFVLMRYVAPIPKTELEFESFIGKLKKAALEWKSIDSVAIYGSYCRGNLHEFSDLDVRVITHPGYFNAAKGALFCFLQRAIAFVSIFPLDIYCIDKTSSLNRMRNDEMPFILFDHSGRTSDLYDSDRG